MEEIEKIARARLTLAYDLFIKTMPKGFVESIPKPGLYYGRKHLDKFEKITGLKRFAWEPTMAYNSKIKGFYIPESTMQNYSVDIQIFTFLHELGHIFIDEYGGDLASENKEQIKTNPRLNQKYWVYNTINEGLADYLAIKSCFKSKKQILKKQAQEQEDILRQGLQEIVKTDHFRKLAAIYESNFNTPKAWILMNNPNFKPDIRKTLAIRCSREPEILDRWGYIIGYNFLSSLKEFDLKKILDKPPTTIRKLIYPETYH